MLLRFLLDKKGFTCVDAPIISNAVSINYLKCHFDIRDADWEDVDTISAVFRSATYNKGTEVILDSANNCYIDPDIYRRGGVIQCKLVGDIYRDGIIVSSTHVSDIAEFSIKENVIVPIPLPSKYEHFIAELEIAKHEVESAIEALNEKVASGEFDGADGVSITNVSYNMDGTVVISLSDGTSFTSEYSMKGEKGDRGEKGEKGDPGDADIDVITNADIEAMLN